MKYIENYDKAVKVWTAKGYTAFERLNHLWTSKAIHFKMKIRLYVAVIKMSLQYDSETWPLTAAIMKKLEAAHHKWLRMIWGVKWTDKIKTKKYDKGQVSTG